MNTDIRLIPGADGIFITLAVFAICVVCTFGGLAWQPYPGTYIPGTYAEAAPAKKFQDRAPTAPLVPTPVTVEKITRASIIPTHEKSSLPWSCETIRRATEKLKPDQIARLARVYRLTEQQMAAARRCLKDKT